MRRIASIVPENIVTVSGEMIHDLTVQDQLLLSLKQMLSYGFVSDDEIRFLEGPIFVLFSILSTLIRLFSNDDVLY